MTSPAPAARAAQLQPVLERFSSWLDRYGETSWDHQSYYAGAWGRFAKGLYYKNKVLGMAAVSPMVFSEAFFPAARRLFHQRMRLPIADAHYAMGFAYLYEGTGEAKYLARAAHFAEVLQGSRSPGYPNACWGYPFNWVTRNGMLKEHTPFITTTPYVYEAFAQLQKLQPHPAWQAIMESAVRYAAEDIKDQPYAGGGRTCSYMPEGEFKVVNASAYRAGMLALAAKQFGRDEWLQTALANVDFVIAAQNPDGSWPYAKDGVRDFVDHFHTCFVMKGIAKVYLATGNARIRNALAKGLDYYQQNLFDATGMPRPFSVAPRLTVYRNELYDCAESINLCLLLRAEFPQLNDTLNRVVDGILANWVKPDGSFRSRRLKFGWDNVPMHRWAQSQMFRALAFYLREINTKR